MRVLVRFILTAALRRAFRCICEPLPRQLRRCEQSLARSNARAQRTVPAPLRQYANVIAYAAVYGRHRRFLYCVFWADVCVPFLCLHFLLLIRYFLLCSVTVCSCTALIFLHFSSRSCFFVDDVKGGGNDPEKSVDEAESVNYEPQKCVCSTRFLHKDIVLNGAESVIRLWNNHHFRFSQVRTYVAEHYTWTSPYDAYVRTLLRDKDTGSQTVDDSRRPAGSVFCILYMHSVY